MAKTDFKLPKQLAEVADLLYETRQERLALQKQVEELQARETLMKDHLIAKLDKNDATGIAGHTACVRIVTKVEPQVEDWDKLYKYISRTKSWDLMQRRISAPAVRERWEAGKELPGVGEFINVTVSLTKV
jgi:hypothetical protein